jgi:multiple sugar transport system permease protein/N-acetylglucosamine transport system permease protein
LAGNGRSYITGAIMISNKGFVMNGESIKNKKLIPKKIKDNIFVWCMLALPILHFLVFWLYINANTIFMTFFRYSPSSQTYEWYGLNNFFKLFADMFLGRNERTFNSMLNSLWIFPISNFIVLPLSFICAYFLYKKIPCSSIFRIIFFMPSIISITVLALSYRSMFNSDYGPLYNIIDKITKGKAPFFLDSNGNWAMPVVFLFAVWSGLGYNIVLLNGGIGRIPTDIIEYGQLDGIGTSREMFQIVMPLIWPTISTLFILNSLAIFGWFLPPMLIISDSGGANGSTSTVALYVYQLVNAEEGEKAAALGLMFSMVGIPLVFTIKWLMGKITPDIEF